jgi:hypothetical protein
MTALAGSRKGTLGMSMRPAPSPPREERRLALPDPVRRLAPPPLAMVPTEPWLAAVRWLAAVGVDTTTPSGALRPHSSQ